MNLKFLRIYLKPMTHGDLQLTSILGVLDQPYLRRVDFVITQMSYRDVVAKYKSAMILKMHCH